MTKSKGTEGMDLNPHDNWYGDGKPHKCPVCNGTGFVGAGFYSWGGYGSTTKGETCRSCGGTGIVWEEQ